jgi:dCMP deaminase
MNSSERPDWNHFFFGMAEYVASRSKDRSTKVGAVIFNPTTHAVLSIGYNGFPRGILDSKEDLNKVRPQSFSHSWQLTNPEMRAALEARIEARHERPLKYSITKHAEENAILNCARHGIATAGMGIALQWFPCSGCAGDIMQAGITTMICTRPDYKHPRYGDDFRLSMELLQENGTVGIFFINKD